MTKAIPEGMHTLTPHLAVRNGTEAIEFYKKAFGAKELRRMLWHGDKVMHAALRIGDSTFFLADELPDRGVTASPQTVGGTTIAINVYVENADEAFEQAIKAGATVKMPLMDMFWGDRYGQIADPYGHVWAIASHKEDLSEEEIMKRQESFCKQVAATT